MSLKVHRCLWSGEYPENSLAAIEECYRARVARAEIDFAMLADADFLVVHDVALDIGTTGAGMARDLIRQQAAGLRLRSHQGISNHRPPLLSDVIDAIVCEPYPTLLELDVQDAPPWPWPRVEELARLLEPARDRVVVAGSYDWNLRRLLRVNPSIRVGFNPAVYLDWVPDGGPGDEHNRVAGAYGYRDRHPLAQSRLGDTADYLRDRLGGILRLVPGAGEAHLRLSAFERMLDDGLTDAAALFHAAGMVLDVWTLNAGTPNWQQRLARAVAAGVDVITTDTPHALSAEYVGPP